MKTLKPNLLLIGSILSLIATSAIAAPAEAIKIDQSTMMAPEIFKGSKVEKYTDDFGAKAASLTTLISSDKKFYTGLYRSGPVVEKHIDQDYGDDEFMYLLSGSITLKSISGKVTELKAGDAVSLPKEWRGTWHSDGYTKLWVIYNPSYADSDQ